MDTIDEFIKKYKYDYDNYIISIYRYKKEDDLLAVTYKKNENYIETKDYYEYIFRDTYLKILKNEIKIERIQKYAFIDKLLYIISFIKILNIHDIPLLNKFHNERHIIENVVKKNENYVISDIIDNNISNLEYSCYNVVTLRQNILPTNEILKDFIYIFD